MGYLLAQPGDARGAAVADPAALTSSQQPALTAAASVSAPTKTEFDKVVADAVAARTTVNAMQVDIAALRTKLAALLDSLQAGSVIAP
jgi:hypothetical protein